MLGVYLECGVVTCAHLLVGMYCALNVIVFIILLQVYYKEAVGAFVVFDVTRLSTFEAVQMWKQDLDNKVLLPNGKPIPAVLLANKVNHRTTSCPVFKHFSLFHTHFTSTLPPLPPFLHLSLPATSLPPSLPSSIPPSFPFPDSH